MSTKIDYMQRYQAFRILERGKFSNGYYTAYKYSQEMLSELKEDGNEAYCVVDQIGKYVPDRVFQLCNDTKLVMGSVPTWLQGIAWKQEGEPTPINCSLTYWEDERVQFRICLFDCRQKNWIKEDLDALEIAMTDAIASATDGKGIVRFMSQDELVSRCHDLSQAERNRRMRETEPDWMWISRKHYEETGVWRDRYWNKIEGSNPLF